MKIGDLYGGQLREGTALLLHRCDEMVVIVHAVAIDETQGAESRQLVLENTEQAVRVHDKTTECQ
jgi:hypothetical protein